MESIRNERVSAVPKLLKVLVAGTESVARSLSTAGDLSSAVQHSLRALQKTHPNRINHKNLADQLSKLDDRVV
jgi:hypothetical protein